MLLKMVLKLCGNCFFQYPGNKWKIGNGSGVGENIRVKGGFFKKRSNDSSFQGRWNVTGLKGVIYDLGDKGADG